MAVDELLNDALILVVLAGTVLILFLFMSNIWPSGRSEKNGLSERHPADFGTAKNHER